MKPTIFFDAGVERWVLMFITHNGAGLRGQCMYELSLQNAIRTLKMLYFLGEIIR